MLPHNRPTLQQVSLAIETASCDCVVTSINAGLVVLDMVAVSTYCCRNSLLCCGIQLGSLASGLRSGDTLRYGLTDKCN